MQAYRVTRGAVISWRQAAASSPPAEPGTAKPRRGWALLRRNGTSAQVWFSRIQDGSIALVGANSTQGNTSSTGAVTVIPLGINLTAADCTQDNSSGTGAITLSQPGSIDLTSADASATPTSSTGAITISYVPSGVIEPVSVIEAKLAARRSGTALDPEIGSLITAARQMAEQETGRCYVRKTKRYLLGDWPTKTDRMGTFDAVSVAVTYWDGSAWQTLDGGAFVFYALGSDTGMAPAIGTEWPVLGDVAGGERVRVDITAGPANPPLEVADCVKRYIKATVAFWLDDPASVGNTPSQYLPRLLDSERLWG